MDLLVVSDDRTSAFATAAVIADGGLGAVPVTAWAASADEPPRLADGAGAAVLDLGTRHLSPGDAAERAAAIPDTPRRAHRIDSALRGNWAEELAARSRTRPVLVVPSLPLHGRTCAGGIVYQHGRPIHEDAAPSDVRRRLPTSQAAAVVRAAGQHDVHELADLDAVTGWLAAPTGVAVADAEHDEHIASIVAAWEDAGAEVVIAGTTAMIEAVTATLDGTADVPVLDPVRGPILIASGSVHPVAHRQVLDAEHLGVPASYLADELTAATLEREGALVLEIEIPVGDERAPVAVAAAASLARGVADLRRLTTLGALVLIGGDTAAAVIGNVPTRGLASIDEGTAWVDVDGFDMPVLTRSGGFGSDRSLVDLIRRLREG